MDRHNENAKKIAEFLKSEEIERVYIQGFKIIRDIKCKESRHGYGGMISFVLKKAMIIKVLESLKIIAFAESLGGVESLVCHPLQGTCRNTYEIRQKLE